MATETIDDWAQLREMLGRGASAAEVEGFLDTLPAAEVLPAVFHLSTDEQRSLLAMISAERAAHIVEELPEGYAADLMEVMPVADVAPIVGEMASDDRVDVLGELSGADAEAILEQLDVEDADEIRRLSSYESDTAGGLMMTEFAAFPMAATIRDVMSTLVDSETEYEFLTVHYVYVVVKRHKLKGVIRIRDLLFTDWDQKIGSIALPAVTVSPEASLEELEDFFEEHDFAAVPVVDERDNLLGIVRRRTVLEAVAEQDLVQWRIVLRARRCLLRGFGSAGFF